MYLNDLPAVESWTSANMSGKAGACVPETMRFNGNGYYNGGGISANASCATASSPSFNAETITSGAEIALWIWQQYQDTGNLAFLQKYYPVLQQTATFLLAWQSVGSDGYPARRGQRPRDPVGRVRSRRPTSPPTRRCSPRRSAPRPC